MANPSSASQRNHEPQPESPSVRRPGHGIWEILRHVKHEAKDDAVGFYAAGVSFYLLLALVPTLAAVAGVYGLLADPTSVVDHVSLLEGMLPGEIIGLITTELETLAASERTAGWALVGGLALALWGSSKSIEALTTALNRVYDEEETRGYFKRKLVVLCLTAGLIVFVSLLLLLLIGVPAAIAFARLDSFSDTLIAVARWPMVFLAALVAITTLYRFAPCQRNPRWRWFAPGSLLAAAAWVGICAGLTFYASHTGAGSKTYGSLAAVVLLMSFFYLSAAAILLGGELNTETEHLRRADRPAG
jgi:membrane protein